MKTPLCERPNEVRQDPPKHRWDNPVEIVGGCKENPGFESGGGLVFVSTEVCTRCGLLRIRKWRN